MGQDIVSDVPHKDYIGHRRLHWGYCIQPPMQDLSPNGHSVLSMGDGTGGMGWDGTGWDGTGHLC